MWNHSALGKGTTPVIAAIERDFKVHLPLLSQEVYQAFKASKGGDETLQGLIKRYTPYPTTHPITHLTPTSTPTIPPQDPNSSTNQPQLPNSVPEGGVKVGVDGGVHGSGSDVGGGVKGGVEGMVDIVERNLKLTAEQAISSRESEPVVDLSC